MEISFVGGEARNHHIEANDGVESLAGLAHAATLVAHFVATGRVRQRTPYDTRLRFYLQQTRPGSLEVVLALGGSLAMGAAGNALYDVIKAVWKRATGTGTDGDIQSNGIVYGSGDIDALTEAVSPSLLRGHSWIGNSDKHIAIKTGRQILVDLNEVTRDYLKDEIEEEGFSTQDVSVAALNANSKYGRVYFFDLNRTVPFKIYKDANGRTAANLSRYLTKYVDNTGATVSITFKKILYVDGRLKRVVIYDCYGIDGVA